jgi:hypothetical protein
MIIIIEDQKVATIVAVQDKAVNTSYFKNYTT